MEKKKILFAASEAVPFIKTGGLADVVGSLPKALDPEKYDVSVILPLYACVKPEMRKNLKYKASFHMDLAWRSQYVGLLETEVDGITFWLVDNEYYFGGPTPYSDARWDLEKFAFFSRAVLSALPVLSWRPDVIHCHDWQTALVPVYLHDSFQLNPFFRGIKTVMTVHNLKFQGVWSRDALGDVLGLSDGYFVSDKLEAYGDLNVLKGGLVYADRLTTVSESYAREIRTSFYGEGLDGLLRARSASLRGIVNGIDTASFDPTTDPALPKKFTKTNFLQDKLKNKTALQEELGLTYDEDVMMIGMVTRLTDQKGLDLVACVLDELLEDAVQLVVLGSGEEKHENMLRWFAQKYPHRVSFSCGYNDALSRRIYAGSDAFLMPSLFEPCGLSQLIALRYGSVPIVRETGGLRDTVEPYNQFRHTGTGFSFANYNAHEMLSVIRFAECVYYDYHSHWNGIVRRAMTQDFSWSASAKKYEALYDELLKG